MKTIIVAGWLLLCSFFSVTYESCYNKLKYPESIADLTSLATVANSNTHVSNVFGIFLCLEVWRRNVFIMIGAIWRFEQFALLVESAGSSRTTQQPFNF